MAGGDVVEGYEETAAEYGCHELCFRDHRQSPFCFQDVISDLRTSKQNTGADGLISQIGVQNCSIPHEEIEMDDFIPGKNIADFVWSSPNSAVPRPPLLGELEVIKEALIPTEELDLGSTPELDLQKYLEGISSKRHCNMHGEWLPLSPVNIERDEGLAFPSNCSRLPSLLNREIERERIEPIEIIALIEDEADVAESGLFVPQKWNLSAGVDQMKSRVGHIDPITPPLSPVSEPASPFIPSHEATVIDLASDPTSPDNFDEHILHEIEKHCSLDAEKLGFKEPSPSMAHLDYFQPSHRSAVDSKVDMPLMATSPEPILKADFSGNCKIDPEEDTPAAIDDGKDGYFDDAFQAVLDDRHAYTTKLSEQEKLNPQDSICRVSVPVLDFRIPQPGWVDAGSDASHHFLLLSRSVGFKVAPGPRDPQLDNSLKWTPVPTSCGRINDLKNLERPGEASLEYLAVETLPKLSSATYITAKHSLAILEQVDDEEIELEDFDIDEREAPSNLKDHEEPTMEIDAAGPPKLEDFGINDLTTLCSSLRRKFDDSNSVLPVMNDVNGMRRLLGGFMDLRGVKRSKLVPETSKSLPKSESNEKLDSPNKVDGPPLPAESPNFEVPEDRGFLFISLGLPRPILRQLQQYWGADHLIDKEYSWYTERIPASELVADSGGVASEMAFEADISASPSTGIIVTNLLKARQKALPGSKTQTPLREHVERIISKYETLFVLVSEDNKKGEFVGTQSPGDMAGYADFVRFAVSLKGDIRVFFVAGSHGTLAKWVLSIICQVAAHSFAVKRYLDPLDTTWDVFLRRAGANVVAAKVLSGALVDEFGKRGLAKFCSMTTQQKMTKYSRLLGGQKALLRLCAVLDARWD